MSKSSSRFARYIATPERPGHFLDRQTSDGAQIPIAGPPEADTLGV
jgi:hypothetical protein